VTHPADLDLVRRILEESGVDQSPPSPGWAAYLVALVEGLVERLRKWFPRPPGLGWLTPRVLTVMAAVLLLAVALTLLRMLALSRRRTRPPTPTRGATPAATLHVERDRPGWRAEVDRRLAMGEIRGALEAVWWFLALSISQARVDPSWTSFELLGRCGRRDLTPLANTMDRLVYGTKAPGSDDLRRLVGQLEKALS